MTLNYTIAAVLNHSVGIMTLTHLLIHFLNYWLLSKCSNTAPLMTVQLEIVVNITGNHNWWMTFALTGEGKPLNKAENRRFNRGSKLRTLILIPLAKLKISSVIMVVVLKPIFKLKWNPSSVSIQCYIWRERDRCTKNKVPSKLSKTKYNDRKKYQEAADQ